MERGCSTSVGQKILTFSDKNAPCLFQNLQHPSRPVPSRLVPSAYQTHPNTYQRTVRFFSVFGFPAHPYPRGQASRASAKPRLSSIPHRNLCRLCRQQFSLSYTPSTKLNFHAFSQPKVDESDDFLPWLEREAGAEISSALSIGKSANGASLFASKSITAGDCVLKVPYSVQLAPDNLVTELKDLLSDGVGDAAKLATVVLFEQRMSKDSGWAPYIRWLPRPKEIHFTALKNFLEMSKSITFKDFMHAYAVVTSRAWGSMKGYSLSLVNWPRKLQNMMVDWLDIP